MMRERLISLILNADGDDDLRNYDIYDLIKEETCGAECFADYLLKNGVIVPPCKVGDVIYETDGIRIYESIIRKVIYETKGIAFDESAIGKSVFLSRDDAERALKGVTDKFVGGKDKGGAEV